MKGTKKCVLLSFEKYQRLMQKSQENKNTIEISSNTIAQQEPEKVLPLNSTETDSEKSIQLGKGSDTTGGVEEEGRETDIQERRPPPPGIPNRKRQRRITAVSSKRKKSKVEEWKTLWENLK